MTVCIAAICRQENRLLAVTDLLLSGEFVSHDTQTLKLAPISQDGRWLMMYAGEPSVHLDVQNRATEILAGGPGEMRDVVAACERAFQEVRRHRIESEVLSTYGLDLPTFIQKGRAHFGGSKHSQLCLKAEAIDLETDILVMGFDSKSRPYIFDVRHPGVASHHGGLGFHAVGTGDVLALGALAATFDVDIPLDALAYRMCEAKFTSELARSVGEKTYALALHPDGKQYRLKPEQLQPIRDIALRPRPPVPTEAVEAIRRGWVEFRWVSSPPSKA